MSLRCVLALVCFAPAAPGVADADPVGRRAEPWVVRDWIGSPPLELAELRGKVVLVRWWTGGCPFCSASAPALNAFHRRYAERGLVVLGFYHHKAEAPFDRESVAAAARAIGLEIPIAIDHGWSTLQRWWLEEHPRAFTSVTFLIDKEGVIRHVHAGGEYRIGDADHRALEAKIEALLGAATRRGRSPAP